MVGWLHACVHEWVGCVRACVRACVRVCVRACVHFKHLGDIIHITANSFNVSVYSHFQCKVIV